MTTPALSNSALSFQTFQERRRETEEESNYISVPWRPGLKATLRCIFSLMVASGWQRPRHSPAPFMAPLSRWASTSASKPAASVTVPRFPIWSTQLKITLSQHYLTIKQINWNQSCWLERTCSACCQLHRVSAAQYKFNTLGIFSHGYVELRQAHWAWFIYKFKTSSAGFEANHCQLRYWNFK